jgi:hypothetical protein
MCFPIRRGCIFFMSYRHPTKNEDCKSTGHNFTLWIDMSSRETLIEVEINVWYHIHAFAWATKMSALILLFMKKNYRIRVLYNIIDFYEMYIMSMCQMRSRVLQCYIGPGSYRIFFLLFNGSDHRNACRCMRVPSCILTLWTEKEYHRLPITDLSMIYYRLANDDPPCS